MAFGTIIVKDSNGNVRSIDISQYITMADVQDALNQLPNSISNVSFNLDTENSLLTLTADNTDGTQTETEINLSDLLPSAVIQAISDNNKQSITSIIPSINDNTLTLEITNGNNETDTKTVSLESVITSAISNIPEYSNGNKGLVPATTDSNAILTTDGWKSANELSLADSNLECEYVTVKKEFEFGFATNLSNISHKITANLKADEIWSDTITVDKNGNEITGCAFVYPYINEMPSAISDFEYYGDMNCWENRSNHYAKTFQILRNAFTVDAYISSETSTTATITITVYGPKELAPRLFELEVDGVLTRYYENMLDTDTVDFDIVANTISIYSRGTKNTALYWGEEVNVSPVELTSTEYDSPYLPFTVIKTETGIRLTGKEVNIENWDTEISNTTLHLVQGNNTTDVSLNCLTNYVSSSLADIDSSISSINENIQFMSGIATTESNGLMSSTDKTKLDGLTQLPRIVAVSNTNTSYAIAFPDQTGEQQLNTNKPTKLQFIGAKGIIVSYPASTGSGYATETKVFQIQAKPVEFCGDGITVNNNIISVPEYSGATSSDNATSGLVPSALVSEKDMFLRGDGSWAMPYDDIVIPLEDGNIDLSQGRTFDITLDSNIEFTISNAPAGKMTVFNLAVHNNNEYSVTFPSNMVWDKNLTLTYQQTDTITIYSFMTLDGGTTWYANKIFSA